MIDFFLLRACRRRRQCRHYYCRTWGRCPRFRSGLFNCCRRCSERFWGRLTLIQLVVWGAGVVIFLGIKHGLG